MHLVTHLITIPWPLQPGFFITLLAYLIDAAAVAIVLGMAYALMRGFLCLDGEHGMLPGLWSGADKPCVKARHTSGWNYPLSLNHQEGSQHEA
ncbi:MAG: hypothetical protein P8178_09195 [Candidatus Thiodiazotropha sp.]